MNEVLNFRNITVNIIIQDKVTVTNLNKPLNIIILLDIYITNTILIRTNDLNNNYYGIMNI